MGIFVTAGACLRNDTRLFLLQARMKGNDDYGRLIWAGKVSGRGEGKKVSFVSFLFPAGT